MLFALSFSVHAQENFFQGKSIRIIRGGQPGDLYDLWTRHIATYLGKHIPGNPSVTRAKHAGRGFGDRGELCLQRRQAGRPHSRLDQFRHLHGSTDRPQRSAVRLGEVQLDRHAGTDRVCVYSFAATVHTRPSTICARPASRPNAAPRARLRRPITFPSSSMKCSASSSPSSPDIKAPRDIDVALERGELQCRLITIAAFFGREPHITWYKKGFTRPLRADRPQTRSLAAGNADVLRPDGSLQKPAMPTAAWSP